MTEPKKHYFLVTSELVLLDEDMVTTSITRLNAVIHGDSRQVNGRVLSKAQQAAQMNFYKQNGDSKLKVVDVVMLNLSYLGEMTEEEFLGPKEKAELTA